jgi:hypothetical protein
MRVDQGYAEEDEDDTNADAVAVEVQRCMDKVLCERQAYVKVILISVVAYFLEPGSRLFTIEAPNWSSGNGNQ